MSPEDFRALMIGLLANAIFYAFITAVLTLSRL